MWQHKMGRASKARHVAGVCREFSEQGGALGLKLGSITEDISWQTKHIVQEAQLRSNGEWAKCIESK